jgi:hypothetical protein
MRVCPAAVLLAVDGPRLGWNCVFLLHDSKVITFTTF